MRVLVVGGAGYIGSHTVYELIKDHQEVIILDNLSSGYMELVHPEAKFYQGDIRLKADVVNVFKKEKIDVVMHFAAKIIVPESVQIPLEYYYNNVEGVRVLLEVMNEFNVKKFVFSSTAAVYGEASGVCQEDMVTKPINPYGETKLACEKMISWVANAHDFKYVVFRYFNVAGADKSLKIGLMKDQLTHLIPVAIQGIIGIRDHLTIYGNDYPTKDGTCIRDYIHVSDLAYAHVLGAHYLFDGGKSETINLGSSTGYTVLEVAQAVNEIAPLKVVIGPRRDGDPAELIASNEKARRILKWVPKYSLKDIVLSDYNYRKKISKK
ncbi:MAG TPA: UDP-glucose 4-epimerase GalE [Acholeplasmataceae bacterium]|nr:MAG: UDP-glucose 4-epimerase GalE [Tenericutes bacterium GWC2_39_45]OHE32683.1 MAG: UDP-glucose 4-epimerase GalE [Tenericutes bacterium GWD2_38_27]OHE41879.1 MAG: UDP-glucose 4-epimerase GalE [Tenericutes bacterium GWF2_38_8]HBG33043.1 UDP-glucose 4-epimerase GalE [Acholeplasmataceae bacterium]HBY65887.1 UDP-glucose 4-epimerase GalE [Acholeplasmataceae bacterium]